MTEVVEDTKIMADENGNQNEVKADTNCEETTINQDEASSELAKPIDEQQSDSAVDDKVKSSGDENEHQADEKADADKSENNGSKSPDNKRKDAPVSVSAHDRGDRKRSRGGSSYNRNIKTRFDDLSESNDPEEIKRQVEFYFSDSNLPIDAYLLDQTGGHKNRPVELKVIHNFKRMRHFQPFSAVRDAVKESKFLVLNENDEITRRIPLDEKFTDDPQENRKLVHSSSMPRSIYAKGFGEETKSTQLDIEAFFEPYGPIKGVRLRRADDGLFKGSVFVEFENESTQQAFLELEEKPEFDGKKLQIMSKSEYVDLKHEGIMDGLVKPRSPTRQSFGGGRGDRRGRGGDRKYSRDYDNRRGSGDKRRSRDHIDKDDWRERRDREQDGDRRDRHGGRGRGRGRGGRDRGGRGGRRPSPDYNDRKRRRRSDADDERDEKEDVPSRAEAEAVKANADGDAFGGASEAKANGEVAEGAKDTSESKKRAREDDGEEQGETKKVKEVEV